MANTGRFRGGAEEWESGKLGRDEKFAKKVDASAERALDDALGMQMISIRLQKKLIENLKFISKHRGIGYQPLIRELLTRFVVSEFKLMLHEARAEAELKQMKKAPRKHERTRKVA